MLRSSIQNKELKRPKCSDAPCILSELFQSKQLNNMLSKYNAGAGSDDLKSELFVVLCSQDSNKILELDAKGQLMFFAT
jgi:hypothetical protein